MKCTSVQDAKSRYGEIINGVWADEAKWMVMFTPPSWFSLQVINSATGKPTGRIYMNKDLVEPLTDALRNLVMAGCYEELKTFGGCFIIRDVRGMPGKPSTHSYGLALDFNEQEMPLGAASKWSDAFVKAFTDAGFTWGGNFKRLDPQHFSLAWE